MEDPDDQVRCWYEQGLSGIRSVFRTKASCRLRRLTVGPVQVVAILTTVLILSACDQNEPEEIEWQLPLSAPEDPHGADVSQEMPQWAANAEGSAVIALLEKNTARVYRSRVHIGETISLLGVEIHIMGAASGLRFKSGSYIEDENVDNPAVFVEVTEKGELVYRGWLYKEFPELFGPDSADWKLWLQDLQLKDVSARSSVG